jgi:hypothetical protein
MRFGQFSCTACDHPRKKLSWKKDVACQGMQRDLVIMAGASRRASRKEEPVTPSTNSQIVLAVVIGVVAWVGVIVGAVEFQNYRKRQSSGATGAADPGVGDTAGAAGSVDPELPATRQPSPADDASGAASPHSSASATALASNTSRTLVVEPRPSEAVGLSLAQQRAYLRDVIKPGQRLPRADYSRKPWYEYDYNFQDNTSSSTDDSSISEASGNVSDKPHQSPSITSGASDADESSPAFALRYPSVPIP